jgi:NAD(P)-dependent dehydrogenase (short-subunit alcohol dehydrogenase family)
LLLFYLQAEGYTVVGIDQHSPCAALEGVKGVHQFCCNLQDLCVDEDGDAKRGTSAARMLKSLLASLQPATTSAGPKLALLVNNAAFQVVAPFSEMTLKDFNAVINTNLTAPYMLTKLLLPMLKARICNVTVAAMRFR